MIKMEIYEKVKDDSSLLPILSLPVYIKENRLSPILCRRLEDYYGLVSDKLKNENEYDDNFFMDLRGIIDTIKKVIGLIDSCKFDEAYKEFSEYFKNSDVLKNCLVTLNTEVFYRARCGEITSADDMFHVPVNKNYLCKSNRFSESGYPALYLSNSETGCMAEIEAPWTVAKFKMKEAYSDEIKILDLTFLNFKTYKPIYEDPGEDISQKAMHLLWPLLAACYCISFRCDIEHRQYEPKRDYKVEYVFPQMLSRFLREERSVDGIKYFTVRDENLNPNEETMADFVFFTNGYNEHGVDERLRRKFDISIIHKDV